MTDEPKTDHAEVKALPGSFEATAELRRDALCQALARAGMDGYITNTFDDAVVLSRWQNGDCQEWRVTYSVADDGSILIGTMEPAEIIVTETLVTGAAAEIAEAAETAVGMGEGAYMGLTSDTELAHKSFDIDTKAITQTTINGVPGWTFEGYYSEWNTTDNEGDITRPGFTDYSLQKWGLPPVRYEHTMNAGITLEVKSDERGPWMKGFIPDDPQTSLMYKLMKVGGVAKMSYGYKVLPGGANRLPTGERELKAIRLMEISPVAIPMHDGTAILAVKADVADGPIKELLYAAARTLYTTCARTKEFAATRLVKRAGVLGDDNLDALAVLGDAAADTLADLVGIQVKAGRTTAKARWKLIRQLRDTLTALIDSIPEDERADELAPAEPTKTEGKGESLAPTPPTPDGKGETVPASDDVRALEFELLTMQLARHGRRIMNHGD